PASATRSTTGMIRVKNFAAYLLGETSVYSGYSCTYAAAMYGGWGPPYSSHAWAVTGATVTGGQGTGAINVTFPSDGWYSVLFSARDAQGVSAGAGLSVFSATPGFHVSGCEG